MRITRYAGGKAVRCIRRVRLGRTALKARRWNCIEADQLGSPRQVILPGATTANDVTKWKWDYFASNSAFGENAPSVATITFNLRFPGQYFDAETGLNYNYFRDYEPGTGRYVESDPDGLDGGVSTYSYTRSDPLGKIDPLGLSPCGTPPDTCRQKFSADAKWCGVSAGTCIGGCFLVCALEGPLRGFCTVACVRTVCTNVLGNCLRRALGDYTLCRLQSQ